MSYLKNVLLNILIVYHDFLLRRFCHTNNLIIYIILFSIYKFYFFLVLFFYSILLLTFIVFCFFFLREGNNFSELKPVTARCSQWAYKYRPNYQEKKRAESDNQTRCVTGTDRFHFRCLQNQRPENLFISRFRIKSHVPSVHSNISAVHTEKIQRSMFTSNRTWVWFETLQN